MRCILLLALLSCLVLTATAAAGTVDFEQQIAPILEQHCIRCHSPGNSKGDISLATIDDLRKKEYVSAGEPDGSYLVELVSASNGKPPAMPKEGKPLSADDVALLRKWIAQGAEWPKDVIVREQSKADSSWWSLQALATVKPVPSSGFPEGWKSNPIDQFVFAKLTERGLRPNPPADRRTMIRRATYDLIGLPPTPNDVEAFVNDPDPQAYEKLIDRLLNSPRYGERWGRHWLDVVRFGESNGFERNVIINDLWPFRDYVIQSLNEDKPFDQFIREHLAGDVIGKGQPAVEIGSAFLVAGPYDNVGNQDPVQAAQIRANTIDEIIRATGEAFLGLTMGCARCHDHKFDPLVQRDYYTWYATFAGVRHGSRVVATAEQKAIRKSRVEPLENRRDQLTKQRDALNSSAMQRGLERLAEYQQRWRREASNRQGTEESFPPVDAKFVRLVSLGQDVNPADTNSFGIDEFEIWSSEAQPRNVALASSGAKARGASRTIEDFPGAYGPQKSIDGKTGERFLATGGRLTIELARPTNVNRVLFSSARDESKPEHSKFAFVADYRIEVSLDGKAWTEVANSSDRRPVNAAHRNHRLRELELTDGDRQNLARLNRELATVNRELADVPPLPTAWVGTRSSADAEGPFHVFLGGSPQRKGEVVVPASLSVFDDPKGVRKPTYQLSAETPEAQRRLALANWIVHPSNPLTPRVLANRLWHYHFGTGIVDTPSDFGYMGGKPTHSQLLDWLAAQVHEHQWRLKPLHKLIMTSASYRQSSDYREDAASLDGDARLLWRFPPRRLSAEEIRDTMLALADKLNNHSETATNPDSRSRSQSQQQPTETAADLVPDGGPGFRLYRYLQDNVATYVPLDKHGPETYRRAVYHQNARAAPTDLMTDFDQPDCAFSSPTRAETTTPLQALTMLNHSFTLDMARFLSERLGREAGEDPDAQIRRAFLLCYSRQPSKQQARVCRQLVDQHGLASLCRVLFNTSEMIYVR